MRSWIPLGALAFVIASGAATAQMQTPPEHQRQPQPQAQPQQHDGGSSQPIDHQKERARQQDGEPGRIDGQPGNTAGRTPENGQAIPLAPSNESTAQVAPGYPGADVPGASRGTVPSKYAPEVAALDDVPIMARPLPLTEEQKSLIWQVVSDQAATENPGNARIITEPAVFLPRNVQARPFPEDLRAAVPRLRGLKYVKTEDKLLLVQPANGIVRDVLEKQQAD